MVEKYRSIHVFFLLAVLLLFTSASSYQLSLDNRDIAGAILFDAKMCDSTLLHKKYMGDTIFVTDEWLNHKPPGGSKLEKSGSVIIEKGLTFIFAPREKVMEYARGKENVPVVFFKTENDRITVAFIRLEGGKLHRNYGNKIISIRKSDGKTIYFLLKNNLYCLFKTDKNRFCNYYAG